MEIDSVPFQHLEDLTGEEKTVDHMIKRSTQEENLLQVKY